MDKFVKFLGKAALAGKQIAVYESGDGFRLAAETVGGKPVLYSYRDSEGEKHTVAVPHLELTVHEFEAMEDRVFSGITVGSDVRVVQRALIEMGYPAESFEQ